MTNNSTGYYELIIEGFSRLSAGKEISDMTDDYLVTREPISTVNGLRIWSGTDRALNLCIVIERESKDHLNHEVTAEISARSTVFELENSQIDAIVLTCKNNHLKKVFAHFVEHYLNTLAETGSAEQALGRSRSEFRNLLKYAGIEIPIPQLQGLFAELTFLSMLAEKDPFAALEAWKGPDACPHDFKADGASVEVKSNVRDEHFTIAINGLNQLTPPTDGTLTLAVAEIENNPSGKTVADLREELCDLGVDVTLIDEKVANMHMSLNACNIDQYRFIIRRWRYWEINESSPVINRWTISEEIVDAVSKVRYNLNL